MRHVKEVSGDMKAHLLWRMVAIGPKEQCWPWLGTRNKRGYGELQRNKQRLLAHRVAYAATNGPIPVGLVVRHTCDTPCCVNPSHLEIGSQADNMRDMHARGRHLSGERHPLAKLTTKIVWAIRSAYASGGVSMSKLARQYGVGIRTIHAVIHNQRWKEVVFRP